MTYREVSRKLERLGCQELPRRGGGSPRKWVNPLSQQATVVPDWGWTRPQTWYGPNHSTPAWNRLGGFRSCLVECSAEARELPSVPQKHVDRFPERGSPSTSSRVLATDNAGLG